VADSGRYLIRHLLLLWLGLPVLAQLVALLCFAVAVDRGGWWLVVPALVASGALCAWVGRVEAVPASWGLRYAPVLGTLLLLWAGWAIDMHLSGGDFTRGGLRGFYLLLVPWWGVVLMAALGGGRWAVLVIPTLAYAGFALAWMWRLRAQPATGGRAAWPASAVVLAGLALVIGWQFQQRWQALAPSVRAHAIEDEVNLADYRPFQAGNRLVRVAPPAEARLDANAAPRLDGATAAYPVYAAMAQAFYTEDAARAAVTSSRTSAAYERLIEGKVDAIFVAQASEKHRKLAGERGVQLQSTPIAREAFVFLASDANPVRSLRAEQLRAIYAGRIVNWREVGGADLPIVAYQRPENSGSQTVMLARVMQGEPMRRAMQEEVAQGMGGLVRRVAAYRNAPQSLGYSFRYFATSMHGAKGVRLLAVDGVEPTPANIANGTYPFTVDLFMVTASHSRPATERLRAWLLAPEGQQLIANVGYLPLVTRALPAPQVR
jgi:phosphate transport system substrate-binding protein